jgi:4-oxalocrotonate tautomerase
MYRYMPVVHVELYEGRTRDAKQKIVAGITDVFVKEGISPEAVTVILVEIKKENYGHNGKLLS